MTTKSKLRDSSTVEHGSFSSKETLTRISRIFRASWRKLVTEKKVKSLLVTCEVITTH